VFLVECEDEEYMLRDRWMARRRGKVAMRIERVMVLDGGLGGILTEGGSGFSGSVASVTFMMDSSERREACLKGSVVLDALRVLISLA